jgi:YggT family protein
VLDTESRKPLILLDSRFHGNDKSGQLNFLTQLLIIDTMFIFANLLTAIAQILDIVLSVYMWIIIIAALISWVNPDPYNPIVRFLYSVTDPVLNPIRKRIRLGLGGIDISPLIVILIIMFIKRFLITSLIELAYKMKGGHI